MTIAARSKGWDGRPRPQGQISDSIQQMRFSGRTTDAVVLCWSVYLGRSGVRSSPSSVSSCGSRVKDRHTSVVVCSFRDKGTHSPLVASEDAVRYDSTLRYGALLPCVTTTTFQDRLLRTVITRNYTSDGGGSSPNNGTKGGASGVRVLHWEGSLVQNDSRRQSSLMC
jgi:hypothetical protein